jgi:HNH endonuclease
VGPDVWAVAKPSTSAEDAFIECNGSVRDLSLKIRMIGSVSEVVSAAAAYEDAAVLATLHRLDEADFRLRLVSLEEMIVAYQSRFAGVRGSARGIYDKIKTAPRFGRCPMCGHRDVTQLDHYLPKTRFPALAVNPQNLVPICAECNKRKASFSPASESEQFLHPYYDKVQDQAWLRAEVVQGTPAAFRFFVQPPADWPPVLGTRVKRQFFALGLSGLYASQAAQQLASIRYSLRKLHELLGDEGVRHRLADDALSSAADEINHWRTAMYAAMSVDLWFCSGGFSRV